MIFKRIPIIHKPPKCYEHFSVPIVLHSPAKRVENFFIEKPLFFTYITLPGFSVSPLALSQASFTVHSFFVSVFSVPSLLFSAVLSLLTTAPVSGDFLKFIYF